ncbi:hypothetical protein K493DRAFT_310261 [Basidiobolus meristosporus CBS 931.73]|uniref:GRAM domain-containing protein n=1 Tax=Basidiobolus meristosporus CBS 931.73 TaxID=1314790 RepID=A0A1Y1ZBH6_9FUNG|nr:hypothetical protein K493DRAFT_310261 [Basidiobolus meristosporus CBS 931.73]|eukprot:ORY07337.1 hypothetical protein K493DRAFT_310261 [Basidiobolus meristosporus CBS 931.73]
MSINTIGVAWYDSTPSFPLHPGETIIFIVATVDLDLDGTAGLVENRAQSLKGKGSLFLTNTRVVFINKREITGNLTTFSMDIPRVRNPSFKQPFWGSNAFECNVLIQGGGALKVKFSFIEGGAYDFWKHWAEAARNYSSQRQEYVEPLPLYQEAVGETFPAMDTSNISQQSNNGSQ